MAFGASERLAFILDLDAGSAIRGMKQVGDTADRELGRADGRLDRLGGRMQTSGAAMVGFAGVAGAALFGFAQAAEEAEGFSRRLDQALATNASTAGVSRQPYEDLAASLQDLSGADGDAILGMESLLLTFGRTQSEVEELTPLILDFAMRYGLEFDRAATIVNRALDGNTRGLERYIGGMAEGETATAALQRTVGGFAEREGASFNGQLNIMKQNLGDVAEGIGVGVIDAVSSAVGVVGGLTTAFGALGDETTANIGKYATYGAGVLGLMGVFNLVGGTIIKFRGHLSGAADSIKNVADKVSAFKAAGGFGALGMGAAVGLGITGAALGLQAVVNGIDDVKGALEGLNELSTQELVDRFLMMRDVAGAFNDAGEEATFFRDIAEENIGTATRLRDALREQGVDTATLDGILGDVTEAQQQANSDSAIATELLGEQSAATEVLNEKLEANRQRNEEARDAQQQRVDGILGALDADLRLADALRGTNEAIGTYNEVSATSGVRSGEAAAALDTAAGRALDFAGAADEAARKNAELNDQQYTAQDSARVQREALSGIAGSLDANSPLRARLNEYIAQLREAEGTFTATIETYYKPPTGNVPPGQIPIVRGFTVGETDPTRGTAPGVTVATGPTLGTGAWGDVLTRLDAVTVALNGLVSELRSGDGISPVSAPIGAPTTRQFLRAA